MTDLDDNRPSKLQSCLVYSYFYLYHFKKQFIESKIKQHKEIFTSHSNKKLCKNTKTIFFSFNYVCIVFVYIIIAEYCYVSFPFWDSLVKSCWFQVVFSVFNYFFLSFYSVAHLITNNFFFQVSIIIFFFIFHFKRLY